MNICMLAYTFYIKDNRVRRYAEALAERGDHVEVFALHDKMQPKHEIINGVHVYRIQERVYNEKGKSSYLFRMIRFLFNSAFHCTMRNIKVRYDVIHVHSLPDIEVFAAFIPKLLGAKVILDIHDVMPELYVSKFSNNNQSAMFKMLLFMEKISCAFADHVIIANHIWEERIISRAVKKEKCSTYLNYPDESIFQNSGKEMREEKEKTVIVYPGSLNYHQGIDYAIEAFSMVCDRIPNTEFHIYGDGSERENLVALIQKLNIGDRVFIKKSVVLDKIPEIMASADIGIVPKRSDSFGNEAFSTKIFEFMALGVPVLVADTKIDTHYFNDSLVKFFKSGDKLDLSEKIVEIVQNKAFRSELRQNASQFMKDYVWDKHKQRYFALVDGLAGE